MHGSIKPNRGMTKNPNKKVNTIPPVVEIAYTNPARLPLDSAELSKLATTKGETIPIPITGGKMITNPPVITASVKDRR